MKKIICFIKGVYHSVVCLNIVSGCNFIEVYDNKDVQILKCECCGKYSVGFKD